MITGFPLQTFGLSSIRPSIVITCNLPMYMYAIVIDWRLSVNPDSITKNYKLTSQKPENNQHGIIDPIPLNSPRVIFFKNFGPEQFHKGYFTKSSMDTKSPFSCSASDIAAKVSSFGILISNGMHCQIALDPCLLLSNHHLPC